MFAGIIIWLWVAQRNKGMRIQSSRDACNSNATPGCKWTQNPGNFCWREGWLSTWCWEIVFFFFQIFCFGVFNPTVSSLWKVSLVKNLFPRIASGNKSWIQKHPRLEGRLMRAWCRERLPPCGQLGTRHLSAGQGLRKAGFGKCCCKLEFRRTDWKPLKTSKVGFRASSACALPFPQPHTQCRHTVSAVWGEAKMWG